MYPHHIRLRGPWDAEPLGPLAPPVRRVTMPCRWIDAGLAGFRGVVRFTRKFGYPGKADPDLEHIWLTCAGCTGCRQVTLNGHTLGQVTRPTDLQAFAFDVTSLLRDRNQLEIDVEARTDDAGLWDEIALEIRKDAYLVDVRAVRGESAVIVTGLVMGVALRPLELYTLVDARHVDYRTIEPRETGEPFRIELADVIGENVRVELIHISEIWYVVELPISHWKSP